MSSKILDVPYYVQPTPITCQSTCLKMYANYLNNNGYSGAFVPGYFQSINILDIWKDINEGQGRPSSARNSYENMVWWLNKNFTNLGFEVKTSKDIDKSFSHIVNSIEYGFPVMVSTNHARTDGHIILIVGYSGYDKNQCSNIEFICHDPYGRFNPNLFSNQYGVTGKKRGLEGGYSLANGGGEVGPGKSVSYDYNGIRRIRSDKHSTGAYCMITVKI